MIEDRPYREDNSVAVRLSAAERIAQLERRCDGLEKQAAEHAERIAERTNRIVELEHELGIEREKSPR